MHFNCMNINQVRPCEGVTVEYLKWTYPYSKHERNDDHHKDANEEDGKDGGDYSVSVAG
jgi:hypothetical protein